MLNYSMPLTQPLAALKAQQTFGASNISTRSRPIVDRQLQVFAHELLPSGVPRRSPREEVMEQLTLRQIKTFYNCVMAAIRHRYAPACASPAAQGELPLVFLRVEKDALCNPDVQRSLIKTAQTLTLLGFKLIITLPNTPLRQQAASQAMYASLYALNDAGIDLAINRTDSSSSRAPDINPLFPWHLIRFIFTSAEQAGIPFCESSFQPDLYHLATDTLADLLNQYPVRLIISDVDNAWQACLARTLPVHFFQGQYFSEH